MFTFVWRCLAIAPDGKFGFHISLLALLRFASSDTPKGGTWLGADHTARVASRTDVVGALRMFIGVFLFQGLSAANGIMPTSILTPMLRRT